MKPIELLSDPAIRAIVDNHIASRNQKEDASYNLFTISSYNSYLENFHSDIIASLLNPLGLHRQGNTFLFCFLEFLNEHYQGNLEQKDFENVTVTRERGRLDIWIKDEVSRHSIIIENKINNADDMDEQINRYFDYAENVQKYPVKCVVYLSLDGYKHAPPTAENFQHLVKNIGAFTGTESDLVNGWLKKCNDCADHDNKSLINQYTKLIKHLANNNMDIQSMEQLYQFLSTNNGMDIANTIVEMNSKMSSFRKDKFSVAITDYAPFNKKFPYLAHYILFEYYVIDGNKCKFDVWFESDGSAEVVFWNTTVRDESGRLPLTNKLQSIGYLDTFSSEFRHGGNGYGKSFKIGEVYSTMAEVDSAVISFTKDFFKALKSST